MQLVKFNNLGYTKKDLVLHQFYKKCIGTSTRYNYKRLWYNIISFIKRCKIMIKLQLNDKQLTSTLICVTKEFQKSFKSWLMSNIFRRNLKQAKLKYTKWTTNLIYFFYRLMKRDIRQSTILIQFQTQIETFERQHGHKNRRSKLLILKKESSIFEFKCYFRILPFENQIRRSFSSSESDLFLF